jgi:hypothetical protein
VWTCFDPDDVALITSRALARSRRAPVHAGGFFLPHCSNIISHRAPSFLDSLLVLRFTRFREHWEGRTNGPQAVWPSLAWRAIKLRAAFGRQSSPSTVSARLSCALASSILPLCSAASSRSSAVNCQCGRSLKQSFGVRGAHHGPVPHP